jgi:hypothetical protein
VGHDERKWSGTFAALMNEMNAAAARWKAVVVKGGEPLQPGLPIEVRFPIAAELFQSAAIESVGPCGARDFIGPAGSLETLAEVVDCGLREGRREPL